MSKTSPTTRIFLVRHGETQWNKEGIFRGRSDVPLSPRGEGQAKAVGLYFSEIHLDAIYTSRLKRAQDTAQAIAAAQPPHKVSPVHTEEGLTDIHRGEWEGLTHEQAKEKYPDLYKGWFENPAVVSFPGGDNLKNVQRKAWHAFERISQHAEGLTIVLVSHHVVLRVLLCSLFQVDLNCFRQFEIEPASVSLIEYPFGRPVLMRLNDVCHLQALSHQEAAR